MTRTERTYYLIYAAYNLSWSFIGPLYVLFLLGRGLDLFQVSVVPAVYWIVAFFLEIPRAAAATFACTGIIAAVCMSERRGVASSDSGARRTLIATSRDALRTVHEMPVLWLLCLLTLGLAFTIMPAQHFWQPRMQTLSGEG